MNQSMTVPETGSGIARKPRTLVVDDDPLAAQSLQALLSALNFEVLLAFDIEQAWKSAEEFQPDVLLVDYLLGEQENGLDLAREIRGWFPQIPIVIMSGFQSTELASEVERMPRTSLLAKPFSLDALLPLIQH